MGHGSQDDDGKLQCSTIAPSTLQGTPEKSSSREKFDTGSNMVKLFRGFFGVTKHMLLVIAVVSHRMIWSKVSKLLAVE